MIKKIILSFSKILTSEDRKKIFSILFLMILLGLFEVIGVAAVGPFTALLMDKELYETNKFFVLINSYTKAQSYNSFFVYYSIFTFLILFFVNILSIIFNIFINRFSNFQSHKSSVNLFRNYLSKPFDFFLRSHEDKLSKNILTEVHRGVGGIVLPVLNIFSKIIILIFIIIFLCFVNFLITFSAIFILFLFYFSTFSFLKKKLTDIGEKNNKAMFSRFKFVNESFKNIKFLKLSRNENKFVDYFFQPSKDDAKTRTLNVLYSILPRYIVEIIAFFLIILLSIVLVTKNNSNITDFLPMIGVFCMATFRIIPTMQNIYASFTSLRYNMPSFDLISNDLNYQKPDNQNPKKINKEKFKSLELKNYSFRYAGEKEDIYVPGLKISAGNIIGLCGKSGSGKTTTLDLISGILSPKNGFLLFNEKEINIKRNDYYDYFGYVPQSSFLFQASLAENISLENIKTIKENININDKILKVCLDADLTELTNKLDQGIYSSIGSGEKGLSQGQIQRVGIARALYQNREILILDESTSSLDIMTENTIINNILNLKKTIIIVSHKIDLLKKCDYLYYFKDNKIFKEGKPSQIEKTLTNLEQETE